MDDRYTVNLRYYRTIKGLSSRLYCHMKGHSKKRKHEPPQFTLYQFRLWLCESKEFALCYDEWVKKDFEYGTIPSVDRLDDAKPYIFENMRIVSLKENQIKNGRQNGFKNKRRHHETNKNKQN